MEYLPQFLAQVLLGILIGATGVYAYQRHKAKKIIKELMRNLSGGNAKDDFFKKMQAEMSREDDSVTSRLKEVDELQQELLNLAVTLDEPQRNALDGRGKQFQGGTFDSIQEEINNILQSILDDGLDPTLAYRGPENKIEQIKLSELMKLKGFEGKSNKDTTPNNNTGTLLRLVKDDAELPLPIPGESGHGKKE